MKYCNQCGANLPVGATFCNHCGNAVYENKASYSPNNNVQNTVAPRAITKIKIVMIILICMLSAVTITALVFVFIKVFLVNSNNSNNSSQYSEAAFSQEKADSYNENSQQQSNDAKDIIEQLMPMPSQQTTENEEQPPAIVVEGSDFLTGDPVFANGLEPNILGYLDGTAWISTGRVIKNPMSYAEDMNVFSEYEWMYTFDVAAGELELNSTTQDGLSQWDYITPDEDGYYLDTFFYHETIDGVDQIWNTRLFVVNGLLYDVLMFDGEPVSNYSVFERYQP